MIVTKTMENVEKYIENAPLVYLFVVYNNNKKIQHLKECRDLEYGLKFFDRMIKSWDDLPFNKVTTVELREYKEASSVEYTIHSSWHKV